MSVGDRSEEAGKEERRSIRSREKRLASDLHQKNQYLGDFKTTGIAHQAHTAQAPAMLATIPPEINIGRVPRVLLKIIPLRAPATILFAASCFPRLYPIKELIPL